MPVTVMLFLQFKTAVNPWIKALVFGAMAAFVGEPIFEWLGFYSPEKWSSFYSFPIYGATYLMADRISRAKTFAICYHTPHLTCFEAITEVITSDEGRYLMMTWHILPG